MKGGSMANKFSSLRQQMSPESQARAKAKLLSGLTIEDSERWLHEPEMKERLAQADKCFRENPPEETSLNELEAKLKGK